MLIRVPRGWEIPEQSATPETAYRSRRRFLGLLAGAAGASLTGLGQRAEAGSSAFGPFPDLGAARNPKFVLETALTDRQAVLRYNNFYEFSLEKDVYRHVERYQPRPFSVEVAGLVNKPKTWDLDELVRTMPLEERVYRFRCVEAWYMDVPWTGFPLRKLLEASEPLSKATHVRFLSLLRPEQMPGQKEFHWYRWPYYEGLTLAEAMNELTLATVGIYGQELPKQNGAPFRIVVPWKYGYKSPKAVVRIELTDSQPHTFWNDSQPQEYSFLSNVNPMVPHPRWSQAIERSIDGGQRRRTLPYNGYGEWVAGLYA